MELDELKGLWQQSTAQLTASLRLNALLLQQSNFAKVRTSLDRLTREVTLELLLAAIGIVLVGSVAAHNPQARFIIPAVAIDFYAIGFVIANVRQLTALKALDFDEPVVALQLRLQALRVLRIRTTLGALLFGPLMWLPFFILGARFFFGVDLYAVASQAWFLTNVLFGLAVIPIAMGLARVVGPKLRRSAALRVLADDIAGRSLTAALNDLATLRDFAEEASDAIT